MTATSDLEFSAEQLNRHWAQLPDKHRWGTTHGVDIDADGLIHILHTADMGGGCQDCIYVFTADGEFVRSWGPQFQGSGHGLCIHSEGDTQVAYITDLKRGLFKTTLDGEIIWHCAKPSFYKQRPQLAWKPSNVAIDAAGQVYLADGYGSFFIIVFDQDGKECDLLGGPGLAEQHLTHPHGLGIIGEAGQEQLLVCDNRPSRLHLLSLTGEHQGFLTTEHLIHPRHIIWWEDRIVIPDLIGNISFFDKSGSYLGQLGQSPLSFTEMLEQREGDPASFKADCFVAPHDAAVSADGMLYVTEWLSQGRVGQFDLNLLKL